MPGETISAKLGLDTASFNKPLKEASDLWVQEQKRIAQATQAAAAQVEAAQKKQASTISQSIGTVKDGLGTLTGASGEAGGSLSKVWGLISKVPGVGPIAAIAGSLMTAANQAINAANAMKALDREMQAVFTRPVSSGSSNETLQARLESLRGLSDKIAEQQKSAGAGAIEGVPTFSEAAGTGIKSLWTKSGDIFNNAVMRPFTGKNYDTKKDLEEREQRVKAERSRTNRLIGQKRVAEAQGALDTSFGFNPEAETEAITRNYSADVDLAKNSEGGATEMKQAADIERERAQKALDRRVQDVGAATRNATRGAENQKTAMSDSAEQAEYAEAARKAAESRRQMENEIAPGSMREDRQKAIDLAYQNETEAIEKKYRIEREELALQRETVVLKGTSAENSIASLKAEIAMLEKRLATEKNLNAEEKDRINMQLTVANAGLRTAGISRAGEEQSTAGSWIDAKTTIAYNSQLDAMKEKLKAAFEYQEKLYTLEADESSKAAAAAKVVELQKQINAMERQHDLETADAQTQISLMEAQQRGNLNLAEQYAIELKYRDKINAALVTGNTELANLLLKQQQLETSAANYAKWKQTPQERQERRDAERKAARDKENFDAEKARVKRDMENGVTVGDTGRRGDAKRAVEAEQQEARLKEINEWNIEHGDRTITEDELPQTKEKKWWEKSSSGMGQAKLDWGNSGFNVKKRSDVGGGPGAKKAASSRNDLSDISAALPRIEAILSSIDQNNGANK